MVPDPSRASRQGQSATLLDGTPVTFEQIADALKLTIPAGKQDPDITVVKLT